MFFIKWQVKRAFREHNDRWNGELLELTRLVAKISDRLDELYSEHRKLRGRFYSARGELAPDTPKPETKAEILARVLHTRNQTRGE